MKLELLIHIDMLIMTEKRIRGGIYHAIHRYPKGKNKYMKNYDWIIIPHVFRCKQFAWMANVSKIVSKWF